MRISHVKVLFLCLGSTASAVHLDIHGERTIQYTTYQRRSSGRSDLRNTRDISYYTGINLGGNNYTLLVDTGSSDIWIAGNIANSTDTQAYAEVEYAYSSVAGQIKTAEVQFAGYTIPNQAFLEVAPDAVNKAGYGILGLGPNEASSIYETISTVAGATLLNRIFLQNVTTPNYLTVLLGRSEDANDFYGGILTIGQVVTGFEDILEQPRLDVVNSVATELHFQVLLDKDGLIGSDGRPIAVNSEVASTASDKRVTAVLDTGFTLPQVPSSVAEAIYGRFGGAQLVTTESVGKIWLLPCLQEVNITFQFGGKLFPIHPLDATLDPTVIGLSEIRDSKGNPLCIGTFQPFSYDTGAKPSYDMILGMAFLRNVYVLMDYGDFINDSNDTDVPYVQFLSTTNATEAHKEFVEMRLDGVDTTAKHLPILRAMRPIAYYIGISLTLILTSVVLALFCISRRGKHPMRVSRKNDSRNPFDGRSKY